MHRIKTLGATFCLLATFMMACSGCATIFKGSKEIVSFSSEPSGAKVYVDGQPLGSTPFQLELKSNKTYTIEFRLDGFLNRTVMLSNSVGAGWIILDVLFGLLPVVIDAATGNWYSLDQTHVRAALETHAQK
jgi:hypothetical protein